MAKPSTKIDKRKVKDKSALLYKIQEKHSEHTKVSKCAILIGAGCSYPILPLGSQLIKLCQQLTYIREVFPLEGARIIVNFFHNPDFSVIDNFINSRTKPIKSFDEFVKEKELILKDLVNEAKNDYEKKIPLNITSRSWKDFEELMINDAKYSFWLDSYSNSPKERQRFIEALVDNKNPGGAYIILALLIEMGYFSNILTTNFDDFVNDALLYYTSTRPRFYADDELSQYISVYSGKPNIIKLHGDYRYANIRNTADETLRLSNKMEEKLKELLQNFDLIVIGYNGADYSIMNVLQQAKSPNCELLWCDMNENNVHWRVANLINSTDNSWFVTIKSFDDIIKDFYLNFIQSPPDLVKKAKARQDEIKDFVIVYSQELQKDSTTTEKDKANLKNKDIVWDLYNKALLEKDDIEIIKICDEILKIDDKFANAFNLRGVSFHEIKKYKEAIADYNEAIDLTGRDPIIYYNRAITHHELKNLEAALSDFNNAIKYDSKDKASYGGRANLYTDLKNFNKALEDHYMAISLDDSDPGLYSDRGHTYLMAKNYEMAVIDFKKAIELNNSFPNAHKHLGHVYYLLGETTEALDELNTAIKLNNKYVGAFELRAEIYIKLNDIAKAELDKKMAATLRRN